MTEGEQMAIEWACSRLVIFYSSLLDERRWDEVAALYAPDGLMTRPSAPDAPIVGREAILASEFSKSGVCHTAEVGVAVHER